MDNMLQKLRDFYFDNRWNVFAHDDLEMQVTNILRQIGVPAHIKGYSYLRFAIISGVNDPAAIGLVTKVLYPSVANSFNTTATRVERAMRHAIEVAWNRGGTDILDMFFGFTVKPSRGKPTNSEFIAMIADYLRLKNRDTAQPS